MDAHRAGAEPVRTGPAGPGPSARRHGSCGPAADLRCVCTLAAATTGGQPQAQHERNEPLGVVVGVDGSQIGLDAVRWAVAEARVRGLPLRILHAAPYAAGSTSGTHHAGDILARALVAYRADPAPPITTRRTERDAVASLLDATQHAQMRSSIACVETGRTTARP
jgi:hypothetical protein